MKVIEISYSPNSARGWTVLIPGDGEQEFTSRENALAFALSLTKSTRMSGDQESYVCVEGADGQWRWFNADLLPVRAEGLIP